MNNKELIGLIIRNKRNDLDLKSLYVAKKANISAPYFSHIENGHVHADPLVLSAIYDILQIEFNNDEKWLNKKIKEIKMLHQSIYDYDIEHRNKLYEKMIHDEEKLVSSILILDYLIAKLAYNSTSYKSDECKKIINFLDCVQDRMTAEQQNFYIYYVAVYYKNENQLTKSKIMLYDLLQKGSQETIIPMIYYQLGQIETRLNNLSQSYFCNKQALTLFENTGNIRRIFQVLSAMASIQTYEKNYKEADKKFQEAIKMTKILAVSSLEKNIVYCNASWNAICSKDYKKALKYLEHVTELNNNPSEYYFNKAWSLYHLKRNQELDEFLKDISKQQVNDKYIWDCLTFVKLLNSKGNNKVIEDHLLQMENYISVEGDYEAKAFLYTQLISFYKRTRQYKKALHFAENYINS